MPLAPRSFFRRELFTLYLLFLGHTLTSLHCDDPSQATEQTCAVKDGQSSVSLIPETSPGLRSLFQESGKYYWLVDCAGASLIHYIPTYQAVCLQGNSLNGVIQGCRVNAHFACPAQVCVVTDRSASLPHTVSSSSVFFAVGLFTIDGSRVGERLRVIVFDPKSASYDIVAFERLRLPPSEFMHDDGELTRAHGTNIHFRL